MIHPSWREVLRGQPILAKYTKKINPPNAQTTQPLHVTCMSLAFFWHKLLKTLNHNSALQSVFSQMTPNHGYLQSTPAILWQMPLSDRSLGLVIHVKVYVLGSWLKKGNYYVHVYQSNLSLILSKHQDKCWVLVKLNCSLQHHKQQQVLPHLCRELVLSEAPTKLHQN